MKKTLPFVIFLFSSIVQADFNSAIQNYQDGKFKAAFDEFLTMAETGEKQSQFNLGVMYFQGQHVEKDINQAYAWLKLATESETSKQSEKNAFERVKSKIENLQQAEKAYLALATQFSTQVLIERLYPELVDTKNGKSFHAVPLKIVNPKYPRKASYSGTQGWVRYKFDVDKLGVPRNIQLLESFPDNVFVRASQKAILKWQFKPALNNDGVAIGQKNVTYKMEFRLSKSAGLELKEGVFEEQLEQAINGDPNAQFNIGYYEKKLRVTEGKENPNDWFLKAAIQGHPIAQLELGESLIYGQGCEQDKAKGIEWLTRAAHNGQSDARQLLSSVASRINTLESHQKAIDYLKDIKHLTAPTQLSLAWMLAISPFEKISDPSKSLDIVDKMSSKIFTDDITLYEIKAAAYAALGNFKKAVNLQEDALEEAEDREADTESIKAHLASYQKKQKWF